MATQEVAVPAGQVPDLVRTPALTITHEDVAAPRIYIGQFMSAAVQQQLVKAGSIFAALAGDDPDPNILYVHGDKKNPGVLFYVLGLRKGKSISADGELKLWDFDDPNAPAEAWVTYNYTVFAPDVDTDIPCKLLLTRTGRQTALKINTVLARNVVAGPAWVNAFRLTTAERENSKGKFYVAQVKQVEADAGDVKVAEGLALSVAAAPQRDFASTGEQPAI